MKKKGKKKRLKKRSRMMKNYDVIIIGAGVAGMTAGIYAKRAGKAVAIFESKACGGEILQSLKVTNWPGEKEISGPDLMEKIHQQVKELGVEIIFEEVEEVKQADGGFLVTSDETKYNGKTVIIATGTVPRKLDTERAKEIGDRAISYCAICDGALYKDKPVAVIGGGNTAKYDISYVENIASIVYPVLREDPIPEDAVAIFVAIGREPATKIFEGLVDLDEKGYVVAGEDCQTSTPGIFVAGDSRTKNIRQLITASSDGAIAASMAVRYLG